MGDPLENAKLSDITIMILFLVSTDGDNNNRVERGGGINWEIRIHIYTLTHYCI